MPINAFNSFADGLDPNRRNRGHFIANINPGDDRRWVPYAEGVWLQPCCFNVTFRPDERRDPRLPRECALMASGQNDEVGRTSPIFPRSLCART